MEDAPVDARKATAPIKGRGAASRVAGRFEKTATTGEDDGWDSVYADLAEAPRPLTGAKALRASSMRLA